MTTKSTSEHAQSADVTQTWVEAQRRLWDGWLEAMRLAGSGLPTATGGGGNPSQVLSRAIDTWEPFVRQSLDAQTAAMQAWIDGMAAAPNIPPQMRPQLQQVQELTRGWTDTQRQLWEAMFAVARQMTASTAEHNASATAVPTAEVWQRFARPVLEAQATWLRQWSGLLAGVRNGQPQPNGQAHPH